MSGDAVVAIREERTRIGNVEVSKQTALIATDQGVFVAQTETVQHQPGSYRSTHQALPAPNYRPAIQDGPDKGCCDYCCCECDSDYPWYELEGKGCLMVLLLLLMYLVLLVICLPFLILYCIFYCICFPFRKHDEDNI